MKVQSLLRDASDGALFGAGVVVVHCLLGATCWDRQVGWRVMIYHRLGWTCRSSFDKSVQAWMDGLPCGYLLFFFDGTSALAWDS